MSVPTVAQKGPYPVEVEAGKSSKSGVFCDGSHTAL
jgi:hypothetical protein